jgi:hypothetical protein
MTPDGEELQAVGAGLEGARNRRLDAHGVQGANVDKGAVQPRPAASAQDHVDLLGLGVAVRER